MKKEREKKLYYVVINGNGTDDAPALDISALGSRKELNDWLTGAGAKTHRDILKAGQCWLELDDGRECLIIYGALRAIKTIAKVAVV